METSVEIKTPFRLGDKIEYQVTRVAGEDIMKNEYGAVTLLAFDKDAKLDDHAVPYQVMVQVLEGSLLFTVEGADHAMKAGDALVMPKMTVHHVKAAERSKVLLTKLIAD